ncbi:acyl-CoA dehydrogenase family protein [Saccharothrix deserti]|uniref:acyl-CoA dehydrogenase family protein n=1 Tax=Saccharothrix deserti TaxID=2593674 RepID=UPI00131D9467|nr:acyl-CoA dehydrogenase [Saccharothrix deserti]
MSVSPVDRYTVEHAPVLESFRAFVRRELVPLARQSGVVVGEPVGFDLREFVRRRSAEVGFYAGDYPVEVGGQSMPFAAKVLLHEYAESCGCPLAPYALCGPAGPSALLLRATAEQRERFLRPLVAGELTRCLALTEPGGGSDLADLETAAVPDGGGWRVRGRKCFVTNAHEADLVLVIAALPADDGTKIAVVFAVPAGTPGLVVESTRRGLGDDLLCEVLLDDVPVGEEHLLGGRAAIGAHPGWITRSLARGRLVIAANSNGVAARALALGVEFARVKESFGAPIGSRQHVQEHVVASRVELESARLLTFAAAQEVDDGHDAVVQSSLAKLAAGEGAFRTVDRMFQVHGAAAWLRGHPMEYLYRHVRANRLVEGTSEAQKLILAAAEGME